MLDELERLEQAATPGPWSVEQWAGRTVIGLPRARYPHTQYVCQAGGVTDQVGGSKDENAALIAAARNALPALLRVAQAAREWEEAQRTYVGLFESSAYESEVSTAEHRLNRAEDDLRAALADLDQAPRHAP